MTSLYTMKPVSRGSPFPFSETSTVFECPPIRVSFSKIESSKSSLRKWAQASPEMPVPMMAMEGLVDKILNFKPQGRGWGCGEEESQWERSGHRRTGQLIFSSNERG